MGLYGAITRNAAVGEAYAGIAFDEQRDLFFSEIDPALHAAVAGGTFSGSTLDYHPKYFLINGQPFNPALADPCLNSAGLDQGDRILMRFYNAGLREFAPMMTGPHFDVVAEGGKAYPFARTQYQLLLMPGSTKDVIFTPAYEGTFNLIDRRLNLTNNMDTGGGFQACFTVAVVGGANDPPIADAGGPYSGEAGLPVQFDGSGSSDPENDPLTYAWDFGDGNNGTGVTPMHTYAAGGSYTVALTVDDGNNPPVTSPGTTATIAANQAPTANANGPYSAKTGAAITFSSAGSSDPEGQPLTYSWDFGDGGASTEANPSHTYATAGTYPVQLIVNDGLQDSAPSSTTAVVTDNIGPTAVLVLGAGSENPSPTVTVNFDGSGSTDGDTPPDPLTYTWNFADGSGDIVGGATIAHTFPNEVASTTYSVTLTVDDGIANDTAQLDITILGVGGNDAPVANPDAYNPNQVNPNNDGKGGLSAIAAPGVLANDTDDGNPNPPGTLSAVLVSANGNLKNFVLNPDGSFSWIPVGKVGTWSFLYQANDGELASGAVPVDVTREIRVKKALFKESNRRWTVNGTSSELGSTVTIYLGTDTGGTILGTAVVNGAGNWMFREFTTANGGSAPEPGAETSLSVDNLASTVGCGDAPK